MGLKGIMQSAARTAFNVAGDVKKKCQYTQVIDDGLGEAATKVFTLDVLFGSFSRKEMAENDNVQPGDVLGTVLFSEMQVKPVKGDIIRELIEGQPGNTFYRVEYWDKDTAEATVELHLRTM